MSMINVSHVSTFKVFYTVAASNCCAEIVPYICTQISLLSSGTIVCGLVERIGHLWHLSVYYGMRPFVPIQKYHTCNPEPGPSLI